MREREKKDRYRMGGKERESERERERERVSERERGNVRQVSQCYMKRVVWFSRCQYIESINCNQSSY